MTTQNTQSQRDRKRIVIAGGSLLAIALLATAAAFTDFANLNLGDGSDGSGIGVNSQFNIQVVGTDENGVPVPGTWQEANTNRGVNIAVPGADVITPGDTVSVSIPFRNESPLLSAEIDFSLQDRPSFASDAEMRDLLRYTVSVDGEMLAAEQTQDELAELALGTYLAGTSGSLTLSISLPEQDTPEENNALQNKSAFVQAHFGASSKQP